MVSTQRTNEKLWERIKSDVRKGDSGGKKGQWSAVKSGISVRRYKQAMAKMGKKPYKGPKPASKSNAYLKWIGEDWGTKSGRRSRETGERFLPRKARESLTKKEYKATSAKKRLDTRKRKQFSKQPKKIAAKTARYR